MVTRLRADLPTPAEEDFAEAGALQGAGTETRRLGELHRVTLSPYPRVIFEAQGKLTI